MVLLTRHCIILECFNILVWIEIVGSFSKLLPSYFGHFRSEMQFQQENPLIQYPLLRIIQFKLSDGIIVWHKNWILKLRIISKKTAPNNVKQSPIPSKIVTFLPSHNWNGFFISPVNKYKSCLTWWESLWGLTSQWSTTAARQARQ